MNKDHFPKVPAKIEFWLTTWGAIVACVAMFVAALFLAAAFSMALCGDEPMKGTCMLPFAIAVLAWIAASAWFLIWQYRTRNQ